MESEDNVTIKLHLSGGELRRFQFSTSSTFEELVAKISSFSSRPLKLRYIDDEGDHVSIANQEDWKEALRLVDRESKILHIHVVEEQEQVQPTKQQTAPPSNPDFNTLLNSEPAQQIMANLGVSKEMAAGFLQNFMGGTSSGNNNPMMQMFAQHMQKMQQQQSTQNNNNPEPPALCDSCDLPIAHEDLRFHCLSCEDFDLHQQCYNGRKHDASHLFVTQYATEDKINNLVEVGGADRDMCVDFLNVCKGDLDAALTKLSELLK